jgi:acetyl esterase/lipase
MNSKTLGAFLSIAMSSCGSSANDGESTTDSSGASTDSTTSATAETAVAPPDPDAPEIALAQDLPYFDAMPGLNTPVLDVFGPAGDGPWPIVVTFHPDSAFHTKSRTINLARAIAEQGAVVINPTYGGRGTEGGRSADVVRTSVDQSTCAVWFAIENAADYGGDVSDIRLKCIGSRTLDTWSQCRLRSEPA